MKRPSPRNFLAFCLLTLTALLVASCSSNSDSTNTDNPDTLSEASETRQTTRSVPFAAQNSNSETADRSPVSAEPKTPDNKAIAMTTGHEHSCALHEDNTISCWGNNVSGQLGGGTRGNHSLAPVKVASITDATAITAGYAHSCALHQNGTISCWGNNERGQLGDKTDDYSSLAPVKVASITDATAITAGSAHSCALHEDGTISCWGRNTWGQLGNGQSTGDFYDHSADSSVPVEVAGITDATAITAGSAHSCALHEDGTISCWGRNTWGGLGDKTDDDSSVPAAVADITDATAIAAGGGHSCALHQNGTISCWGNNEYGQLGDKTDDDSSVPAAVAGITDATAITAGYAHSCALHQNSTISCWGNNENGQLGNGTEDDSSVPVGVAGITDATAITAGYGYSCALHEGGTISCWGEGHRTRGGSSMPVAVAGITDATAITTGDDHSCALHQAGTISCWGNNSDGQLGDGTLITPIYYETPTTTEAPRRQPNQNTTTTQAAPPTLSYRTNDYSSSVPVGVAGIADATAITAGDGHSCALHQDGTISCWGSNSDGRLGSRTLITPSYYEPPTTTQEPRRQPNQNTTTTQAADYSSSVPVGVAGITDATAITAGYNHSCALHQNGTISCWGSNGSGQLGNGTYNSSRVPVGVAGITDATAITVNDFYYPGHSCALHKGGTISCWGDGGGTPVDSSVPAAVAGIADATAITAGWQHSCALHQNGTISCWGNNDFGQLGNGTEDDSSVPVGVVGIADATAITAGDGHSCALHQDGTISCWGGNSDGRLGSSGTYNDSSVPVGVAGITDATAITAGGAHSCALHQAGTISCWGGNRDGQLGDASWLPRFVVGFGG